MPQALTWARAAFVPEGQELLRELVRDADVLVESFRSGQGPGLAESGGARHDEPRVDLGQLLIAERWSDGAFIGALAERGADRRPAIAFAAFVAAQITVFGIGVPWLKISTGMDWSTAIHDGFAIFIVGGLIKAALAAGLTPVAWRAVRAAGARP